MNKIALVVKTFMPHSTGGIQEAVSQIIKAKNDKNFIFEVITCGPKSEVYLFNGVKVRCFKENISFFSNPINFSLLFNFRKIFSGYDLIHIHSPWPFIELISLFLLSGKKLLVTYHCGIFKFLGSNAIYTLFFKILSFKAKKIIFTSSMTKESVKISQPRKSHTIPLWFDEERVNSSGNTTEAESFLKKNKKYAIFIGSLRWYKGLDLILKVFEKNTQWKLVIVGEGILKSHLQQHIKEKKLLNVFLMGYLKDSNVFKLLKKSKMLLLPSISSAEAFGNVLLEASFFKVPMITTELGTATSYVNKNNHTGLVIPPNNIDELEKSIKLLFENDDLSKKLGQQAHKRLKEKFSEEKNFQKLTEIYLEVNKK